MTAALAALLETPAPARGAGRARARAPHAEAVPEPIGVAGPDGAIGDGSSSGADIALCEVEILEASGPIRKLAEPPPLPARAEGAEAAPIAGLPAPVVDLLRAARRRRGRRCTAGGGSAPARSPEAGALRARARRRALRPRSRAARRAAATARRSTRGRRRSRSRPTTASTRRTCSGCAASSSRVRAETPADRRPLRPSRHAPVAGRRCGRRALPPVAAGGVRHDVRRRGGRGRARRGRKDWALAGPRHARRASSRSATSLKLGVVEVEVVDESSVRVVVRECVACAGAHDAGQAMCHFEGGLVAGAIASIFGRPVRVRETACTAAAATTPAASRSPSSRRRLDRARLARFA